MVSNGVESLREEAFALAMASSGGGGVVCVCVFVCATSGARALQAPKARARKHQRRRFREISRFGFLSRGWQSPVHESHESSFHKLSAQQSRVALLDAAMNALAENFGG